MLVKRIAPYSLQQRTDLNLDGLNKNLSELSARMLRQGILNIFIHHTMVAYTTEKKLNPFPPEFFFQKTAKYAIGLGKMVQHNETYSNIP